MTNKSNPGKLKQLDKLIQDEASLVALVRDPVVPLKSNGSLNSSELEPEDTIILDSLVEQGINGEYSDLIQMASPIEQSSSELDSETQITLVPRESVMATLTGISVSLDESDNLQNASLSSIAGDSDDNDISSTLLPSALVSRLMSLDAGIPIEAALSGYDGVSGKNVFNFTEYGAILNMSLTDASGMSFDGDDSGIFTAEGQKVFLFSDAVDPSLVLGKASDGTIVFAIYLEEVFTPTNGGVLWTVLYEAIYHGDPLNPDESVNLDGLVFVKIESVDSEMLDGALPGEHLFFMGGNGDAGYIVTAREPSNQSMGEKTNEGDRVNVSRGGGGSSIGVNNQMIDPPAKPGSSDNNSAEGLVITFVVNPDSMYTGNNLSQTEADVEANILFEALRNVDSAIFTISQTQPVKAATLKISAYTTAYEVGSQFVDGLLIDDAAVSVIGVSVFDEFGNLVAKSDGSMTNPFIEFSFSDGAATVKGVLAGHQIEYETDGLHNRVLIENPGSTDKNFNSAFDIGIFSYERPTTEILSVGEYIVFEDAAPFVGESAIVVLDDDTLAGGNPGGIGDVSPDTANTSGTLSHSFGADGMGSIAWLTTGAPAGFSYEASGDDLLVKQGAVTVMTLTLNTETGAYSVVQNAPIMHAEGMDENDQNFSFAYLVTDADGDTAEGGLMVSVDDDTPVVMRNEIVQLDDDALAGGNPGGIGDVSPDTANTSGTLSHSFGADGMGSIAWLTTGAPAGFSYEASGDDLLVKQGAVTVMTLTLNTETGAYAVTQNAPIMHAEGMDENDQNFSFAYLVTDADGDTAEGELMVSVDDGTPVVMRNEMVQLDDDDLAGGNPGGIGDVNPDTANTSGTLSHSFGADGMGSIAWLTTGAPVGFSYEASGDDLLVKQGAVTVMTLTLNTETGAYSVVQNAPIMHAEGMDENDQNFSFAYLVTDADGDTAEGGLMVSVDDDTPVVMRNEMVQLDDDTLVGGNPGGIGDVSPDTANTSGTLSHSFGADGMGSIAWLTTGAPAGFSYEASGDDLLVKQGAVTVMTLTLNTETGAYAVTQNAPITHAEGMDENDQNFSFAYLVTDADGDTAEGELMVSVDDDTPVVMRNEIVQLDDDALAGGNPGGIGDVNPDTANTSGVLGHSFGADGMGSIAWLTTGAPAGFSYEVSGDDLLVKQGAVTVMTLTLNTETGTYAVTQNAPIMHAEGMDENDQNFSFAYLVTDADGDTAEGVLMVSVDDDTPVVMRNEMVQLDDDALAGGNPGGIGDVNPDTANTSGTLSHSFGADGMGSIAWLTTGAPVGFSYEASGDDLLVKQGAVTVMTLTLNTETGAYSVVQNAPIMHAEGMDENDQNFSFAYLVTDADGDTAEGGLMVSVDDDTPVVMRNEMVQLDDDTLVGGNPGGIGDVSPDTANTSGTLSHSFGADGMGSIAWLTTGAPAGFSYEASGDDLLVKQGAVTVMTLTLNTETGAYAVTQNAPIMHAEGMDENDQNFSFGYLVTDADGDTAEGELMVSVDDDTPVVMRNEMVQLDDDALARGNPGGIGDVSPDTANTSGTLSHSFGADGMGSIAWLTTGAPAGFSYESSGDDLLVKQGAVTVMTLTLNTETGAYAVTQNAPIMHAEGMDENDQNFSFAYLVTDADGDTAEGELMVSVDDDTPVVMRNEMVQLDDDALAGGNSGGVGDVNPDTANTSGVLGHSFGADGMGSIAWLTTGAPAGFSYEVSGDDLLVKQGAVTVMTLTLNTETGAYAVTQNAPIMHAEGMDENDQNFSFAYLVTDADGDTAEGELMVSVDDDTPVVMRNEMVQLDDDALAGGNPGGIGDVNPDTANTSGVLGHSFGADGAGSFAWLTTGAPEGFVYEASGDDLLVKQGAVTVMTLTLNTETGAYAVTQNAPIMHAEGMDENDQNFSFAYLVTDADGDTAEGELMVSVDDDTPVVMRNEMVQLDDDALAGGNSGGVGDVNPDTANTSGVLGHSFGADGMGSIAWLTTGAPAGFSYETSGDDLLVKQGAVTVMTLTLNTETGTYAVTQNAPIMHAEGMDENDQNFSFAYVVTDADGDTAEGELMVSVDDDTPVATQNAVVQLDDDALAGGNPGGIGDVSPDTANTSGTLSHSFGADGMGSIAWLTTGAPAGFSYEASGDDLLVKQGAVTVMTLTLNTETGAYAVTQNAPIMHAEGMDENDQNFSFAYLVTDVDGDTAEGELMVSVDDDTPRGSINPIAVFDDDALTGGIPGGVGDISPDTAFTSGRLDYDFGVDGGRIAWLTSGSPDGFTYEASGDDLLIKQNSITVLTLSLNPLNGDYSIVQNAPVQHAPGLSENSQEFVVTYRISDSDGDYEDGPLTIRVNDDTPSIVRNEVVQLDDDLMLGGNPGGLGDSNPDTANTTGILGHMYGSDGSGSITWMANGAPAGFVYQVSGDDLLVKQGSTTVMTISLNTLTGEYSVVQNAAVIHPTGLDENNQALIVSYRVTDSDGDDAMGQLVVVVNDDSPLVMQNSAVQLDDDALAGGNPGGIGDINPDTANTEGVLKHSFGADGTGSIAWTSSGAPAGFIYETNGNDLLIKQGGLTVVTLTLDSLTGAYTVIQNSAVMHASGLNSNNQQFIVSYDVTDADGDRAAGELVIDVNDDTPIVTRNDVILLDDDQLMGGNPGGVGDVNPDIAFASGMVNFNFGADGAGSVEWLTGGAPEGFSYIVEDETLLVNQGSLTVMTLTLDAFTGEYSVVQNAPIQHEPGLDENNLALIVGYRVLDVDNDSAIGELVIIVNDDTPLVLDVDNLVLTNNSPTPSGTSTFSYSIGADVRSSFSASNSDFNIYTLTGLIGTNAISNSSVTWLSENAMEAQFMLSFDYKPSATSDFTEQANGTLRFDKENGTYTVTLSEPIQGYSIVTTSQALSFTGYVINSETTDSTQPAVAVAALSNSVYAQFTGVAEPGGGTGANNLQAVGVDGDSNTFTNGELITQAATYVTTSNTANGVAGDTIQKGEVLDFDLFNSNPFGYTQETPSAFASEMFLKFDGVGSEDLVVILKLIDPETDQTTTRALIIDNSDILKAGNEITPTYGITLDNNDGAVIIQSNDFNGSEENYLISGAQILVSTEGLIGTGINFNTAIGEAGASTDVQSFGSLTTDNDVIKISDIGLVTSEQATLDLALEFTLAVKDSDDDISDTQTLGILVANAPETLMDIASHSGSMGLVEQLT